MKKTLYQVLGVEPNATEILIADGYRRCQAALESGTYDRNAQVIAKEAYLVLSNPAKRARYDLSLAPPAPVLPAAPRARLDWRYALVIALAAGVISGWWFSRQKAPLPNLSRRWPPPSLPRWPRRLRTTWRQRRT